MWLILLLSIPPCLFLTYYATVVHLVCFEFRFEYPTVWFVCLGIALLLTSGSPERNAYRWLSRFFRRPSLRAAALTLAIAAFVGSLFLRDRYLNHVWFKEMITRHYAPIAEALRRTGLGHRAVLVFDSVGYIPFVSGVNNIDPVGLTDNVLSGRVPLSAMDREQYIWGSRPDVYLGPTLPATGSCQEPEEEPLFESRYMKRVFLERVVFRGYRRIYGQLSQDDLREVLHFRMRELRDNWLFLGEIPYPFPAPPEYTHFIYVRADSPHAQQLVTELEPLVFRKPEEFDADDPIRNARVWSDDE
jgi:hypothetical protein